MLELISQASLSLQNKASLYAVDMSFGKRLREARRHHQPKVTQAAIATALSVTPQAVSGWERDEAMPEPDKLAVIAQMVGQSVDSLLGSDAAAPKMIRPAGPEPSDVVPAPNAPRLSDFGDFDVEVRGTTVGGGPDGAFHFDGRVLRDVRRPPGLLRARGVFALHVAGTSMVPKYDPDDLIFVQEGRHAEPGDCVVVELYPEDEGSEPKSFLKVLVRRTGRQLICKQLNPAREIRFDAGEVKQVYRVVKNNELFGG